ncbi:hypothetical protein DFH27DRAFT_614895 [Peziza echinospora]|nr:hypothetical protein DFH27DRAFT_614895 [Peziza echinospora]
MESHSSYSFFTPAASAPQAIPRSSRRLRHSGSPGRHASPDNSIPRTSLYHYTSDSSLTAMYAAQSPSQSPATFTGGDSPSRVFTAVIPPFAAVPPTAPLPPTPPMQMGWEKYNRSKDRLDRRSSESNNKTNRASSESRDVVIVEIVKDTRPKDELRRRKKGLRHVKGNVAEAAHTYKSEIPENTTATDIVADNGLPTPGPTPPSSAKKIIPPRRLHHVRGTILPHLKLDSTSNSRASSLYSNSRRGSISHLSENGGDITDNDEGGIKIDYNDEKVHEGVYTLVDKPASRIGSLRGNPLLGVEIPGPELGIDIPRPDSPFVTGSPFSFEERKYESDQPANSDPPTTTDIPTPFDGIDSPHSTLSQDSGDDGVRLSAIKKFFPDVFTPPTRIDSDKAVVVDHQEEEQSPIEKKLDDETSEVVRHSAVKAKPCPAIFEPPKRIDSEKAVIVNDDDEENGQSEKITVPTASSTSSIKSAPDSDANRFIGRSSIAKRRQMYCDVQSTSAATSTLPFLPQKALSTGNITRSIAEHTAAEGKLAEHASTSAPNTPNDIMRCKTPNNTQPQPPRPMAMFSAGIGGITPGITTENRPYFTPSKVPKFNFIPPTPMPLMTPGANLEKQLGAITPTPAPIAKPSPVSRPSMQSKKLRDSKLHPWWHPRSEHDRGTQDAFSRMPSLDGEDEDSEDEENELCRSATTSSTYSWTSGFGPVRVDKKRKTVGLGGMQIEWVGLGGWYDMLVGHGSDKKKNENKDEEKEKEVKEKKSGIPERRNSITSRLFDRDGGRKRKTAYVDF